MTVAGGAGVGVGVVPGAVVPGVAVNVLPGGANVQVVDEAGTLAWIERGYLYETEESSGQQFPTDTGPIDLLAISKDKQELLVVELKRGRASDAVVGQIQRYMGYIQEEIAEDNQRVRGVIIALDDDKRIRRALQIAKGIDFYRYEVKFNLIPSS